MVILIPVYRYARFIRTTYNFKYYIKFYSNQYYYVHTFNVLNATLVITSSYGYYILYMTFTQDKTGIIHSKCNSTSSCDRDDKLRIEKIESVLSRCNSFLLSSLINPCYSLFSHVITLLTLSILCHLNTLHFELREVFIFEI